MALPPKKKSLYVFLIVLFIVIDMALLAFFFWTPRSGPPENLPSSAEASQRQGTSGFKKTADADKGRDEAADASSTQTETSDYLEELLDHLPDKGTKKSVFYAGAELVQVEAKSISEDATSGRVSVRGLRRVEMLNGAVIETSDDGALTLDPVTGKIEIKAMSSQFTPPPPPKK